MNLNELIDNLKRVAANGQQEVRVVTIRREHAQGADEVYEVSLDIEAVQRVNNTIYIKQGCEIEFL